MDEQERNEGYNIIVYDVITMLIYLLSVLAHDPVHDFGLTIARMKKIVSYINHLVGILHASGVVPPPLPLPQPLPLPPQGQAVGDGGLNLVGGIKSRHRTLRVFGSKRNKKTPSRNPIENFYTLIHENKNSKHSKKSKKSMKSKGSMDSRLSINSKGSMNHKDSVKSKGSNSKSHKGIHKKPLGLSELPTIMEEEEEESVIYSDNMATLPTPVPEGNPYINTYSPAIASVNQHKQDDNNMMLELCIQLNRFIYSLKFCVVQHIMSTPRESGTVYKETILNSISVMIANISMPDEISSANLDTELPQELNQPTKEYAIFILRSMHTLLSHMRIKRTPGAEAGEGDNFTKYKMKQRHNIWLDLFNGPLFDDIMRVIVFGKTYNNSLPEPNIPEIYSFFLTLQGQHGGESGINHTSKIMSGGEKMVLSSFHVSDDDKRDELVEMITAWTALKQQQPPNEIAYLSFYDTSLDPQGVNRTTDARLVRKIHPERFGEMKQMIQRLRDRDRLRVDRLRGEQQPRSSRFNDRLLADTRTYKDLIDSFMEQVKSDFDSLIAEEELAQEAQEAADAARPLGHVQASAVYRFSHVIVLKLLRYAGEELTRIQAMFGNLDPRTHQLLPNLAVFLPIAINYIDGILSRGQFQIEQLPQDFPGGPIEKDKYNTLLFQLYLLGLIHQHGTTAQPGRGLPDIDSKLADYVVEKFSREELKAAYRALGYEYLDNPKSHELYKFVKGAHPKFGAQQRFVVLDNGMPASIKEQTSDSSVCFNPQRQDGAGDLFGGCRKDNKYFANMKMMIRNFEGSQSFFSKHFYNQKTQKNIVNYQFTLGNGLVIANTISEIDFSKAPNNLTANNVFEKAVKIVLNLFKNNPGLSPDQLWDLLLQDENFIAVMKIILDKGIGDNNQEKMCFTPQAGFDATNNDKQFRKIQGILHNKFLFFGVMDRPSFWRALHMAIFASNPAILNNQGQLVVSYTTDRTASTIVHRNCIPPEFLARLQPRASPPRSRAQQPKAKGQSAANDRSRSRGGGGSRKTHRRLYKVKSRYTRKKSRARK